MAYYAAGCKDSEKMIRILKHWSIGHTVFFTRESMPQHGNTAAFLAEVSWWAHHVGWQLFRIFCGADSVYRPKRVVLTHYTRDLIRGIHFDQTLL